MEQKTIEEEEMIQEKQHGLEMETEDDINEFLGKLKQGEEAQLQLTVEYFVKNRGSFSKIEKLLKELRIDIDPNVLSSHYIMSCVETINQHKWDVQK